MSIKYSFIIPVKEINEYIRESVPKILEIPREDYEIIIYPDKKTEEIWEKTKQIESGRLDPAGKRNLAIRDARGDVLIFIDDDAYPKENFLDILEDDFRDEKIVAVGGPGITPLESNFWQRVSGAMFLSNLSGGFPERYRSVGEKKFFADWPAVNLSICKKTFEELGGFQCRYWPGEDTFLCYDLLVKKNTLVLYDPQLIVYHHRRNSLRQHLGQISAYGLHRGFFVKKFTKTSLNWRYFMPSCFLIFVLFGGVMSFFSIMDYRIYLFGWIIYLLALFKSVVDIYRQEKNLIIAIVALYFVFLSHIVYGIRFIQGLFITQELKSALR